MKKAIRRLTLHNFQSHEHTTLDLCMGVNIIVGPSDVGKTSVIRALRWLYYNQPRGTGFMRMGASECWVEVETEDDIIVRRYRQETARKNGYLLVLPGQDPIVFEKHGNTVPDEIRLALGVEEMVIDQDVYLNLNIAYQLEGAFLLETAGTTRAKAIGRLGDAHIVDAAQREIQRDLRAVSQEIDRKTAELTNEQKMLDKYQHLSEWDSRLADLQQLISRYDTQANRLNQVIKFQTIYEKAVEDLKAVLPLLQELSQLSSVEDKLADLFAIRQKVEQWQALLQQYRTKQEQYNVAAAVLEATVNNHQASNLKNRLDDLATRLKRFEQLRENWLATNDRIQQAEATIAVTEQLESAANGIERINLRKSTALTLIQLQRDYNNKQVHLKRANIQLEATSELELAEQTLDRLARLRGEGIDLNERHHAYRQRELARRQISEQLSRLAGLMKVESNLQQIMNLQEKVQILTAEQHRYNLSSEAILDLNHKMQELTARYQGDSEEYLQCLQMLGICPVCHGSIDDGHLIELKKQLEEDWNHEH